MILGFHPIVTIAVLGFVLAVGAGVSLFGQRSDGGRILLFLVMAISLIPVGIVGVALNPWLIDARFRTYREFYRDIEVGMTREQVMALVLRHYPSGGTRGAPKVIDDTTTRLGFFMNPETEREPNCEGIFLSLRDGRVETIHYSRD